VFLFTRTLRQRSVECKLPSITTIRHLFAQQWRENMSDAAQTFSEAYDLIEQGNLTAARQLLDDVRAENENNPDFWWLYAHAVDDPQAGRDALQRVRQLQPDYPGVNNLLQQTDTSVPRPLQPLRPPQSLPDLPKTQGQGFDDDFDMDDDFGLDPDIPQNNSRRNLLIGAAAIIVLLILGALFLPSLLNGGTQPTSTPIAQPVTTLGTIEVIDTTEDATEAIVEATATEEEIETEAATPTEEIEPTDKVTATEEEAEATKEATATEETEPTEEITVTEEETEATQDVASGDGFADLAAQLSDYEVPADGVETGETLLGNTLLVTTCSPPGAVATQSILGIADALKTETLADDIEAVGFRIANCTDDTVVRIIGVSRSDFDAFAADNITAQQLQGLLRPIG
jgi:hypothetical protein